LSYVIDLMTVALFFRIDYIAEGCRWPVDLDLEKLFDRVNHDKLMAAVARRVADKRMLKLIRGFLTAA